MCFVYFITVLIVDLIKDFEKGIIILAAIFQVKIRETYVYYVDNKIL